MKYIRYSFIFLLIFSLLIQGSILAAASAEPETAPDAADEPILDGAGENVFYYLTDPDSGSDQPELVSSEYVPLGGHPQHIPAWVYGDDPDSGEDVPVLWYLDPAHTGDPVDPSVFLISDTHPTYSFYAVFNEETPEYNVSYYIFDPDDPDAALWLAGEELVGIGERPSADYVPQYYVSGTDDFGEAYEDYSPLLWYLSPDNSGTPVDPTLITVTEYRPTLSFYTDFGNILCVNFFWWKNDDDSQDEFYEYGERFVGPGKTLRSVIAGGTFPAAWRTADGELFDVYHTPITEDMDLYPVRGDATVTYEYRGSSMGLGGEQVFSGEKPIHIPKKYTGLDNVKKSIVAWRDESGSRVEPGSVSIRSDTTFSAILEGDLGSDGSYPALHTESGYTYVSGTGGGKFEPGARLTRAQAAKIFYNLLLNGSHPASGDAKTFSDVASGTWYYDAVMTLSSYHIINGYPDGTFKPNIEVSRAEFIAMLSRFYDAVSGSTGFSDVAEGEWFYGNVCSATARHWLTGYDNGDGTYSFRPNNKILRAEAVAIVNRALGRDTSAEALAGKTMPFTDVPETHWAYYHILAAAE